MPLPPLTLHLALRRDRFYALRAEAARRGLSPQQVLYEWISPQLDKLPPGAGPADDPDRED